MEYVYACLGVFIANLLVFYAHHWVYKQNSIAMDNIGKLVNQHAVQEATSRTRFAYLIGVDNLQMWKLGGKAQGLAYKVPPSALLGETVDLGKYYTDEEIAAYKVGAEIVGKDLRLTNIAKDFITESASSAE